MWHVLRKKISLSLAPGRKSGSPLLKVAAACAAPAAVDELMLGLIECFLYPAVQPIHVARLRCTERAAAGCASQGEAVSGANSRHHRGWGAVLRRWLQRPGSLAIPCPRLRGRKWTVGQSARRAIGALPSMRDRICSFGSCPRRQPGHLAMVLRQHLNPNADPSPDPDPNPNPAPNPNPPPRDPG